MRALLTTLMLLCSTSCSAATPDCPAHLDVDTHGDRISGSAVIVAWKATRRIGLYDAGVRVQGACWPIALAMGAPTGTKKAEGDRATPEGWYRTSDKPWSSFYGAIAVHYPGVDDAQAALAEGRIDQRTSAAIVRAISAHEKPPQTSPLGGEVLIHGGGAATDWTLGCIAMGNDDLDTLRARLPRGMRSDLLILP